MELEPSPSMEGLKYCAKEFGLDRVHTVESLKILEDWSDRMQPLVSERQVHAKDGLNQDENRRAHQLKDGGSGLGTKGNVNTKELRQLFPPPPILHPVEFNPHSERVLQTLHFTAKETEAQKG